MAIHIQQNEVNDSGYSKTIDEAGIMLVFDTLQKYQYSYPQKSTVRELLSNALDSVSEKRVAREILTGAARIEDYFVDLEGSLYKDSKFDPSYYDLNWLSDIDSVSMNYIVGSAFEKDKVVFSDYGVGLFGKRLEGYFKLAYSTKRLSKLPLGKFGLGAKSPLSTGVDFYTVESRHNGRLFRFNVYNSRVDSLVPRMNMETGNSNEFVIFNEGQKGINEDGTEWSHEYPVYWIPTEEKNGVTITIEVKKHHKTQYIDALKSQMLYFDNISVNVIEDNKITPISYKAKILYEDDLIVISDNSYYSKPHLLLNKVNYGYIAWDELELEDKQGNIGIKVAPEDIEVNPSRESVLWTEKTKNKVLLRFNQVVDIAANMIQEELNAQDIIDWIRSCYSVHGKYSEKGGIIGRLSRIVDLSKARFKFSLDNRLLFMASSPLYALYCRHVIVFEEREANKLLKKKILRKDILSLHDLLTLPVFLMHNQERAVNRRDKWLTSKNQHGFITVAEPFLSKEEALATGMTEEAVEKLFTSYYELTIVIWNYLLQSKHVTWYDSVEVPEDFTGNDTEIEEVVPVVKEEIEEQAIAKQTAEQRRRSENKTLIGTPYYNVPLKIRRVELEDGTSESVPDVFGIYKFEVPISSINNWTAKEIYYCHDADTELLYFVSRIVSDPNSKPGVPARKYSPNPEVFRTKKWWRLNRDYVESLNLGLREAFSLQFFFDTEVVLVKVSQNSAKYYRDFRKLREFFIRIENKVITMSNTLIRWNTARLIMTRIGNCAFLYNFPFNEDMSDLYRQVCYYVDNNYRNIVPTSGNTSSMESATYDDMIAHLNNVYQFQKFVANSPNDHEGIGLLANKLFGNKDLTDGMAIDPVIMHKFEILQEFANSAGVIFNSIPVLTGYYGVFTSNYMDYKGYNTNRTAGCKIPEELEIEINKLLEQKGILQYQIAENQEQ